MLELAIKASLEAGEAILQIYRRDFAVGYKDDRSPLTEADLASHRIIEKALKQTTWPVLSEESAAIPYAERKAWSRYWLVDPLDGTKEFIKKNGEFTVNIALIAEGVPVLGVVYAPVLRTLYWGTIDAEGGRSAWKAEQPEGRSMEEVLRSAVSLSIPRVPPSPLRIVASRSHCNEETTRFIEALEAIFGEVERVSSGSSLKLCMVAEGSADVYPRIAPTMEWDTAAAHAVVAAAGGQVYEYDSGLPAAAYLGQGEEGASRPPGALRPMRYNKENLLNPYFVVSGLGE